MIIHDAGHRQVAVDAAHERNVAIDAARALSILVVVAFHLLLFRVDPTSVGDGAPVRTFVGSPGRLGWTASWFVMVMPLFFVAGGFANAHVIDRLAVEGGGYGIWLVTRARRLLGPLVFYIAVWATVGTLIAWFGNIDTALLGTRRLTGVLWFLLVYLVVVILAPVMCALHDRWGVPVLVALGGLALLLDVARFHLGADWAGVVNFVVVWLFVHQLGIAYYRGWWRTGSVGVVWATFVGAVAVLLLLLDGAGYPPSAVAVGDQPVANLVPPTAAMAVLALAQVAVLALVERAFGAVMARNHRLQGLLNRTNALAVTIYLWHGPVIALAVGLLYATALRFRSLAPVLLGRPVIVALALPLMVGLVPVISLIERRLVPRFGDQPRTRLAVASMVLLLGGFALLYEKGMILHPASPRTTVGVLCFAAGALMFKDASHQPHRHVRRPRGGPNDESALRGGRA